MSRSCRVGVVGEFTGISRGSVGELKYHLLLARDLKYISEENYKRSINEIDAVSQMLFGLIKSLDNAHAHGH